MVHDLIMGNSEEPGGEGRALPPEVGYCLEHFEEYLLGDVLSLGGVPNFEMYVAVYAFEVSFIKPADGLGVSRACIFYPRALIFRLRYLRHLQHRHAS